MKPFSIWPASLSRSDTYETASSLFAEMVSMEDDENLTRAPEAKKGLIGPENQNKALREAGGKFLSLLAAATNPSEKLYESCFGDQSFGDHLLQIADAFQIIANHELKTKQSKNQGARNPKQARRIELTNFDEDLPGDVKEYYRGIIRYGLFIRDYKGKSVRGKAVPRLVLRGLLIPYYTLTFSKHDSITMTFAKFCEFLRRPKEFAQSWIDTCDDGTLPLILPSR